MNIEYISAVPGVGKTKWAVDTLAANLRAKQVISFYVAPTLDLILEIKKYLEAQLTPKEAKQIRVFNTQTISYGSVGKSIAYSLMGGTDLQGRSFTKAKLGSIFLITHAAFLNMPKVPRASAVAVFFDEARKCVSQSASFPLTTDKHHEIFNECLTLTPHEKHRSYFKVSAKVTKRELTDKLRPLAWPAKLRSRFEALVKAAANPRLETYVSKPKSKGNVNIFEVTLPSKIFEGFARVVLLSAFFEDSQMYHLLKLKGENLKDITSSALKNYESRTEKILDRYRKVSIVPLLSQERTLTKEQLKGFLVSSTAQPLFTKLSALGYSTAKDFQVLKSYAIDTRPYDLNERDKKAIELLTKPKYRVSLQPLEWLIGKAQHLAEKWAQKFESTKPPLLIVNKNLQAAAERLAPNFQLVSTQVHGLNKYYKHDVVIFLAAIQPPTTLRNFYSRFLSDYDIDKDHVADVCIQCVCRGSVRDTTSNKSSLVIVSDFKTMNMLYDRMARKPTLRTDLAPTPGIRGVSLATSSTTLKVPSAKTQTKQEHSAKWRNNPINKQLDSKRSLLSLVKRKLRLNEGDLTKLKAKLDQLTADIAELQKRKT